MDRKTLVFQILLRGIREEADACFECGNTGQSDYLETLADDLCVRYGLGEA